jgi:hypothetical protein
MPIKASPPITPPAIAPALLPEPVLGNGEGVLTAVLMQDVVGHCVQDRLVSAQVSPAAQLHTGGVSGHEIQRRKIERPGNSIRAGKIS